MAPTDALPLDDDLKELFGETERPAAELAREYIVLEAYRRHDISSGRAARLLGMDKWDFIAWSGELGIPYLDLSEDEWAREMEVIERFFPRSVPSPTPAP